MTKKISNYEKLYGKQKPKKKPEPVTLDPETIKKNLNGLYPFGLIPRTEIKKATGGILSPQTMSNLDSTGGGIEKSVTINKKRFYPIDDVIKYVMGKIQAASAD